DGPMALPARDVWTIGDRLQLAAGSRVDHDTSYGGLTPSARAGIRYALDGAARTVIRAGYGSFVGGLPLAVEAFAGHPERVDTTVDPETGTALDTTVLQPTVERLRLPRARAATLQIER